jgi:hypothetical protein
MIEHRVGLIGVFCGNGSAGLTVGCLTVEALGSEELEG